LWPSIPSGSSSSFSRWVATPRSSRASATCSAFFFSEREPYVCFGKVNRSAPAGCERQAEVVLGDGVTPFGIIAQGNNFRRLLCDQGHGEKTAKPCKNQGATTDRQGRHRRERWRILRSDLI
jgi:hypothetical protein